jgi:hypothetical protein
MLLRNEHDLLICGGSGRLSVDFFSFRDILICGGVFQSQDSIRLTLFLFFWRYYSSSLWVVLRLNWDLFELLKGHGPEAADGVTTLWELGGTFEIIFMNCFFVRLGSSHNLYYQLFSDDHRIFSHGSGTGFRPHLCQSRVWSSRSSTNEPLFLRYSHRDNLSLLFLTVLFSSYSIISCLSLSTAP